MPHAPRYPYPHTIENGVETLSFRRRVPGPTGDRLECESRVAPGGGPPMHVHLRQEEGLTVLEGRMAYQRLGEPARVAGPGESVVFRAGEAHRFWNAGEGELRCTGYIEPADNVEYFLTELYASQRRSGRARPDPLDVAFLTHRYRTEFALPGIPAPVRWVVMPLLVGLGRMLGRYGRYADAPAPVGG